MTTTVIGELADYKIFAPFLRRIVILITQQNEAGPWLHVSMVLATTLLLCLMHGQMIVCSTTNLVTIHANVPP